MTKQEYNAAYYRKNKTRLKRKQKLYYETVVKQDAALLQKCRSRTKRWKSNNSDVVRKEKASWAKENPEKIKLASEKQWAKVKQFKEQVKNRYGCMNPNCPSDKGLPAYCLDFHHLKEKKFNIGNSNTGIKSTSEEMNKCTILCAICHRMETWGDLDASKFPMCNIDVSRRSDQSVNQPRQFNAGLTLD